MNYIRVRDPIDPENTKRFVNMDRVDMITNRKGQWTVEIRGQFYSPLSEMDIAIVEMVATE